MKVMKGYSTTSNKNHINVNTAKIVPDSFLFFQNIISATTSISRENPLEKERFKENKINVKRVRKMYVTASSS